MGLSDYRRFVSYMYDYQNGIKRNNIGYARIEVRNEQCKITISIRASGIHTNVLRCYIFMRVGPKIKCLSLGDGVIKNGSIDFRIITGVNNLMNSRYTLDNMGGIIVYSSLDKFFATEWDDKPVLLYKFEELEPKEIENKFVEDTNNKEDIVKEIESNLNHIYDGQDTTEVNLDKIEGLKIADHVDSNKNNNLNENRSSNESYIKQETAKENKEKKPEDSDKKVIQFHNIRENNTDIENELGINQRKINECINEKDTITDSFLEAMKENLNSEQEEVTYGFLPKDQISQLSSPIDNGSLERNNQNQNQLESYYQGKDNEQQKDANENQREDFSMSIEQLKQIIREKLEYEKSRGTLSEEVSDTLGIINNKIASNNQEENIQEEINQRGHIQEELKENIIRGIQTEAIQKENHQNNKTNENQETVAYSNQETLEYASEENLQQSGLYANRGNEKLIPGNNRRVKVQPLEYQYFDYYNRPIVKWVNRGSIEEVSNQEQLDENIASVAEAKELNYLEEQPVEQQEKRKLTYEGIKEKEEKNDDVEDMRTDENAQNREPEDKLDIEELSLRELKQREQRAKEYLDAKYRNKKTNIQDINEPLDNGHRKTKRRSIVASKIFESYPKINAFSDREFEQCVKIEPQDIALFPVDNWILGNNSFLLHGYYSHRHLLFAEKDNINVYQYILGVPGVYQSREKFIANMFGFHYFKPSKGKEPKDGEFGYWYMEINV